MIDSRAPVVVLLAAALSSSCGPGVSPTSPAPSPMVPTFAPGNYTLTLSTPGTPPPAQAGSPNVTMWVCTGVNGSGAGGGSATVEVTVDAQGTRLVGRSTVGSLVLDVSASGAAIGGSLSGAAASTAAGVSVLIQPRPGETSIGLTGTVTSSGTMSGFADGSVQFNTSAGSSGCNSANWSLTPR